jgi:hypothetical protein
MMKNTNGLFRLGVPYATSYWQVGEASEQNGRFKMEMSRAKRTLKSFKSDKAMKIGQNYSDVVPIINKSWNNTFGNVATTQKAIANRGWHPPNRNLLLHPDFRNENHDMSTDISNITLNNNIHSRNEISINPFSLNVVDGTSGSCLDKIHKRRSRNGGIERHQSNLNH